jgi:hypothetical protein
MNFDSQKDNLLLINSAKLSKCLEFVLITFAMIISNNIVKLE